MTVRFGMDAARVESRDALHRLLAWGLGFPKWYGGNLDALYDSLTDLDGETELAIVNAWTLETALGSYAHALRRVLSDAAAENPHLHIVWV